MEIDKPNLRPLPKYPYEYATNKKARVGCDYHVELERHYYSVPHQFISREVMLRCTNNRVECWLSGKCIAVHVRSYQVGMHTTVREHMPKSHQAHMAWNPGRFLNWANAIGQSTLRLVKHLLEARPHPEQGFRSCLGLLSLAKKFGEPRLEQACERAWQLGTKTRRSVLSILEHKLEACPCQQTDVSNVIIHHENVRGKNHYQ